MKLCFTSVSEDNLGAFFHDIVYFQKGTGGVQGALLNLQVKEADLALALAARSIIERYGTKNNKDAVTNLPISERTRNLAIAVWNVFAPITEMKYQREGHIFPPGGLHNPPATPPAPIFISLAFYRS